jgi:hypothetical protein
MTSEDDDAAIFADECARVLVVALRAHGMASAFAAQAICVAMWNLVQRLTSAWRGFLHHGAPRALVAAMIAHFNEPDVVGSTSAALGILAMGASPPPREVPCGMVAFEDVLDDLLPPGSGEEEGEESEVRGEAAGGAAAGGAAADDFVAALVRA